MDTIRATLIGATSTIHHRLHQHKLLQPFQPPHKLTLGQYYLTLNCFFYFYKSLADRLMQANFPLTRLSASLSDLEQDLAHRQSARLELPSCDLNLEVLNQDMWWGVAYVINGSSLGAKKISQHLKRSLPEATCQYFTHLANDCTWPEFLQKLECSVHVTQECCESAVNVFTELERYLDLCLQQFGDDQKFSV